MGLLEEGSIWLSDVFRADTDISVEYVLGANGAATTVLATPAAQMVELDLGVYSVQRTQNRDWLINRADLIFFGEPYVPVPGDRVVQRKDGIDYTYEVIEQPGEGAWRWHDDYYRTFRIHTMLICNTIAITEELIFPEEVP